MSSLPPAPRDHRRRAPNRAEVAEEMFQALEETTRQVAFQTSRQASLQALGPFAALMSEFIERQSALEDFVGFVYVPKAKAGAVVASHVPENAGSDPAAHDSTTPVTSDAPPAEVEAASATPPAASDAPFESTAP